jgi:hypothetical protein
VFTNKLRFWARLRRHSLDKKFPGPPANVPAAGQICFRGRGVRLNESPNALDQIEIEIANASGLQPLVNGSPLQGARLRPEFRRIQFPGFGLIGINQSLDPISLIDGDERGSPDSHAHLPAHLPLDVGNHAAAHSIANGTKVFVGRILAKFDLVGLYICVDLVAPNPEQRPDDLEFRSRDSSRGYVTHSPKTRGTGAAKQVHQKSFHEIIGVMTQEKRVAAPASRDAGEKIITRHPPRRFDRLLRTTGQRGNVGSTNLEFAMKLCGQTFDEIRVGCARAASELMIEMANNEPPVTLLDELMKQRHGISSSGDADEVAPRRRESHQKLRFQAAVLFAGNLHDFEKATVEQARQDLSTQGAAV